MSKKIVVLGVLKVIIGLILFGVGIFIGVGSVKTRAYGYYNSKPRSMEIATYNNMYEQYVSNKTSASSVNSLVSMVRTNNNNDTMYGMYGMVYLNYFALDDSEDYITSKEESEESEIAKINSFPRLYSRKNEYFKIEIYSYYEYTGAVQVISVIELDANGRNDRVIDETAYIPTGGISANEIANYYSRSRSQEGYTYVDMPTLLAGIVIATIGLLTTIIGIILIRKKTFSQIIKRLTIITWTLFNIAIDAFMIMLFIEGHIRIIVGIVLALKVLWTVNYLSKVVRVKDDKEYSEEDLKTIYEYDFLHIVLVIICILFGAFFIFMLETTVVNAEKPIIYIYPEKEMTLNVELGHPELLTTTYPKYEDGWKIKSYPNGDIEDLNNNNRKLYSLYWEGKNPKLNTSLEVGFVVKGEEAAEFLNEKLEQLGLNYKEKEEFIIYWLPKLEHNKYNFIRFALNEECEEYMPLSLKDENGEAVTPDTLIRVLMVFKPLNREINVKEQILPTRERNGFTVVEWGGSEI